MLSVSSAQPFRKVRISSRGAAQRFSLRWLADDLIAHWVFSVLRLTGRNHHHHHHCLHLARPQPPLDADAFFGVARLPAQLPSLATISISVSEPSWQTRPHYRLLKNRLSQTLHRNLPRCCLTSHCLQRVSALVAEHGAADAFCVVDAVGVVDGVDHLVGSLVVADLEKAFELDSYVKMW